jgi:dGTPase
MYRHYRVHRMTRKAERILQGLFEAFLDDPRMLPEETQSQVSMAERTQGRAGQARGVADYIAGMTDRFAITEYQRIFSAEELT